MNAIEIRDLSKSFRGMYAVDHLNMTVPVGAIYGIIRHGKMIREMTAAQLDDSCRTYVASKTISGFVCGALMLIAYFVGSLLGGGISGLSFDLHGLTTGNIAMCLVAKISLMLVFVAIDVIVSVAAKQKAWLCLCGSLGAGMLLFMMVSLITPLGSTAVHVLGCLAGGALFAVGLGAISKVILKKTSLV